MRCFVEDDFLCLVSLQDRREKCSVCNGSSWARDPKGATTRALCCFINPSHPRVSVRRKYNVSALLMCLLSVWFLVGSFNGLRLFLWSWSGPLLPQRARSLLIITNIMIHSFSTRPLTFALLKKSTLSHDFSTLPINAWLGPQRRPRQRAGSAVTAGKSQQNHSSLS